MQRTAAQKLTPARPRIASSKKTRLRVSASSDSGQALYLQIAIALKEEILNGTHAVGTQLPTESDLCARFAVSRFTVRGALRQLRDHGLIMSRQGAGTVVVPVSGSGTYVLHAMSINDLLSFTTNTRFEIELTKMVKVNGSKATRIGVLGGQEWLFICGFRRSEQQKAPVCWTEYYISRDYAAVGRLLPRHHGPIFPLIEDRFALRIAEVQQEVTAVLISREQADRYHVAEGSPALEVRRMYKDADGKIVQVTFNIHPTSHFRLSMTLRRVKG